MVERQEIQRPLCRAYHFTHSQNLFEIENGGGYIVMRNGKMAVNEPGLIPRGDQLGEKPDIFCFMNSPYPSEWKQDPELYKFLLKVKGGTDLQLIWFDVYPEDRPQIIDHGVLERKVNKDGNLNMVDQESVLNYFNTQTPLSEYSGGYRLPELLIPGDISYDRLNFVSQEKVSSFIDGILK